MVTSSGCEFSDVWVGLALEPIKCELVVLGFGSSQAESVQHRHLVDSPYVRGFLLRDQPGNDIRDWLVQCGVPTSEAQQLVPAIGRALSSIMEDEE